MSCCGVFSGEELIIRPFSGASFLTLSSKQAFQTQGEWEFLSINMSKANVSTLGELQDLLIYKVRSEHHIHPAQSNARVKTLSIDEHCWNHLKTLGVDTWSLQINCPAINVICALHCKPPQ